MDVMCPSDHDYWLRVPSWRVPEAMMVSFLNDEEAHLTGGFCFEEGTTYCGLPGRHSLNGLSCTPLDRKDCEDRGAWDGGLTPRPPRCPA